MSRNGVVPTRADDPPPLFSPLMPYYDMVASPVLPGLSQEGLGYLPPPLDYPQHRSTSSAEPESHRLLREKHIVEQEMVAHHDRNKRRKTTKNVLQTSSLNDSKHYSEDHLRHYHSQSTPIPAPMTGSMGYTMKRKKHSPVPAAASSQNDPATSNPFASASAMDSQAENIGLATVHYHPARKSGKAQQQHVERHSSFRERATSSLTVAEEKTQDHYHYHEKVTSHRPGRNNSPVSNTSATVQAALVHEVPHPTGGRSSSNNSNHLLAPIRPTLVYVKKLEGEVQTLSKQNSKFGQLLLHVVFQKDLISIISSEKARRYEIYEEESHMRLQGFYFIQKELFAAALQESAVWKNKSLLPSVEGRESSCSTSTFPPVKLHPPNQYDLLPTLVADRHYLDQRLGEVTASITSTVRSMLTPIKSAATSPPIGNNPTSVEDRHSSVPHTGVQEPATNSARCLFSQPPSVSSTAAAPDIAEVDDPNVKKKRMSHQHSIGTNTLPLDEVAGLHSTQEKLVSVPGVSRSTSPPPPLSTISVAVNTEDTPLSTERTSDESSTHLFLKEKKVTHTRPAVSIPDSTTTISILSKPPSTVVLSRGCSPVEWLCVVGPNGENEYLDLSQPELQNTQPPSSECRTTVVYSDAPLEEKGNSADIALPLPVASNSLQVDQTTPFRSVQGSTNPVRDKEEMINAKLISQLLTLYERQDSTQYAEYVNLLCTAHEAKVEMLFSVVAALMASIPRTPAAQDPNSNATAAAGTAEQNPKPDSSGLVANHSITRVERSCSPIPHVSVDVASDLFTGTEATSKSGHRRRRRHRGDGRPLEPPPDLEPARGLSGPEDVSEQISKSPQAAGFVPSFSSASLQCHFQLSPYPQGLPLAYQSVAAPFIPPSSSLKRTAALTGVQVDRFGNIKKRDASSQKQSTPTIERLHTIAELRLQARQLGIQEASFPPISPTTSPSAKAKNVHENPIVVPPTVALLGSQGKDAESGSETASVSTGKLSVPHTIAPSSTHVLPPSPTSFLTVAAVVSPPPPPPVAVSPSLSLPSVSASPVAVPVFSPVSAVVTPPVVTVSPLPLPVPVTTLPPSAKVSETPPEGDKKETATAIEPSVLTSVPTLPELSPILPPNANSTAAAFPASSERDATPLNLTVLDGSRASDAVGESSHHTGASTPRSATGNNSDVPMVAVTLASGATLALPSAMPVSSSPTPVRVKTFSPDPDTSSSSSSPPAPLPIDSSVPAGEHGSVSPPRTASTGPVTIRTFNLHSDSSSSSSVSSAPATPLAKEGKRPSSSLKTSSLPSPNAGGAGETAKRTPHNSPPAIRKIHLSDDDDDDGHSAKTNDSSDPVTPIQIAGLGKAKVANLSSFGASSQASGGGDGGTPVKRVTPQVVKASSPAPTIALLKPSPQVQKTAEVVTRVTSTAGVKVATFSSAPQGPSKLIRPPIFHGSSSDDDAPPPITGTMMEMAGVVYKSTAHHSSDVSLTDEDEGKNEQNEVDGVLPPPVQAKINESPVKPNMKRRSSFDD